MIAKKDDYSARSVMKAQSDLQFIVMLEDETKAVENGTLDEYSAVATSKELTESLNEV